jgi:hypothetical protein
MHPQLLRMSGVRGCGRGCGPPRTLKGPGRGSARHSAPTPSAEQCTSAAMKLCIREAIAAAGRPDALTAAGRWRELDDANNDQSRVFEKHGLEAVFDRDTGELFNVGVKEGAWTLFYFPSCARFELTHPEVGTSEFTDRDELGRALADLPPPAAARFRMVAAACV